jgi:predicted transcriptional regulator
MTKPSPGNLSARSAEILAILWEFGGATAEQIREALPGDLHDSTVRTLLRRLEDGGFISHEVRGKSFVYSALVERDRVQSSALQGFIKRFFGGSAEALVHRLVSEKRLTREQLDQIRDAAQVSPRGQAGKKRRGGSR